MSVDAVDVAGRVRWARMAAESARIAMVDDGMPSTDGLGVLMVADDLGAAIQHAEAERVLWLTAVVALLLWSRETPSVDPPDPRP